MTITVGLWSWKFHHFWLLWDVCGVGVCHAAQIVVDELIFKLLCSYRRGNLAWEKKKEEEEIRPVWPSYVLSLSPSKRNQTSKTGNRRNQYKQPTANSRHHDISQRPTAAPWQCLLNLWEYSVMEKEPSQLLQGHFEYLMMVAVVGGLLDRHG